MTATRTLADQARKEWIDTLRDLSFRCAAEDAAGTAARLREMNLLLAATPAAMPSYGLQPIEHARLITLLGAGAHESAAMAMFGRGAGYLLSRGGNGQCLASVAFTDIQQEESGSGQTPALALIGAAAMLLADASGTGPRAVRMEPLDASAILH